MTYMQSTLWKRAFGESNSDSHKWQRELLQNAYFALRKQAETLVGNISADLRQYTIHDVTHLDALWGVASEIVGPDFAITPVEGFILGASFLLHDAGMCLAAYPGGLEELQRSRLWLPTLRKTARNIDAPTDAEVSSAVIELIRAEHASRARELPNTEWLSPSGERYCLIESADLRQKFSSAIGDVAASHWWSHERLASELDRIMPAPPPFPTEWRVDLLKIAAVLRVADAAHIDERRAPGFVWALRRSYLSAVSSLHWLFQNRITQPERRDDALHYSSTSDFNPSDADAWWLANDTLRMIDNELRSTDVLLADLRGNESRFATRRVANIESISTMVQSIRVRGWIPIDTTIKISDVPNLIRSLGGEALYGVSAFVPLRELLQNAADAIRLKVAVLPEFKLEDGLVEVSLSVDDDGMFLQVSDNGIGMTREILGGAFLDFGNSGWSTDPVFVDFPAVDPHKLNMIGKFGIGFFSIFMLGDKVEVITRRFSIFMLGDKVEVITRRFDKGFQDTLVLSFSGGVSRRPILRQAMQPERSVKGGTSVKVWINDRSKSVYAPFRTQEVSLSRMCEKQFPLNSIRIRSSVADESCDTEPIDWRSAEPELLLKRITGLDALPNIVEPYIQNLRPIYDPSGEIAGRMFVTPSSFSMVFDDARWGELEMSGMVVSRGVFVASIQGIQGVVESDIRTADRHSAWPKPSKEEFHRWLAEQARLLASMMLPPAEVAACARIIRRLGGDVGDLKFVRTRDGILSLTQFREMVIRSKQIVISTYFETRDIKRLNPTAVIDENLVSADSGIPTVFSFSREAYYDSFDVFLGGDVQEERMFLIDVLGECWSFDEALISALKSGSVDGKKIAKSAVIARQASGEEIVGDGIRCWEGMSIDDLN